MEQVIDSVRPGLAKRGRKHSIQIELKPAAAKRRALPEGVPTWIQIGPYEAKKISREGNIVAMEITIPANANVGIFLDCHIEFASDRGAPTTYKKNDAFRVVLE